MTSSKSSRFLVALSTLLAAGVLALWLVQVVDEQASAGRRVGIELRQDDDGVWIDKVTAGGPADGAGLQAGDFLLALAGYPVASLPDYDVAAAEFRRGQPAPFELSRNGHALRLEVVPGTPIDWLRLAISTLAVLVFLALALLTAGQSGHDVRSRLLVFFLFLLALELAMPSARVGDPLLDAAMTGFFLLVTGAQMGVELHLVSVIPEPRAWLVRWPVLAPCFHILGLGLGGLASATYLLEEFHGVDIFPWSYEAIESLLLETALPLWALGVVVILGSAALGAAERQGRQQAALVLLGVAPWALWVLGGVVAGWLGLALPASSGVLDTLLILGYAVAIFVAIFRFHLFDIELVLRRGLLYTALSAVLVVLFYAMLTGCGALVARLEGGERPSIWVVSAITLVLGMLFHPLRSWFQEVIDRRFFPERRALRQQLIDLAGELPAQGTIPRMGTHLVERLSAIFAVPTASLLLADPRNGLLLTVAVKGSDPDDSFSLSLLLSPDDPGIEMLREADKPLLATRLVGASPALRQRFDLLEANLVVPLSHQHRLVGLLILGRSESGRFVAEEIELLNLLAHQVASSFENVRLFESATYESLTGLLRREAILELLDREIDRAQRYDRPLTIGFADLDHFKVVNDEHGHLAGDALLKLVAEELSQSLRGTDAIGRYGGEEFLLIFPETEVEGAMVVAEKLRQRIASLGLPIDDGTTLQARISIGLASLDLCREARKPAEALIATADTALYRAKANGRNRVERALAVS